MITVQMLCYSDTARERNIINRPNPEQEQNLRELAEKVLDPVEELIGAFGISSGFRCPALNAAVGGEPASDHLRGRAADITPEAMEIGVAFDAIARSGIPFDQLIFEVKRKRDGTIVRWLHVSHRPVYRRQALRAELVELEDGTTRKQYFTYSPRSAS